MKRDTGAGGRLQARKGFSRAVVSPHLVECIRSRENDGLDRPARPRGRKLHNGIRRVEHVLQHSLGRLEAAEESLDHGTSSLELLANSAGPVVLRDGGEDERGGSGGLRVRALGRVGEVVGWGARARQIGGADEGKGDLEGHPIDPSIKRPLRRLARLRRANVETDGEAAWNHKQIDPPLTGMRKGRE